MSAFTDLQTSVANVQTAVGSAVTMIEQLRTGQTGTSDADIEEVVTNLNVASDQLNAAVNAPAPSPEPAPVA